MQLSRTGHPSNQIPSIESVRPSVQILSGIDYCNAVLRGAPTSSIQKLQRVKKLNNAAPGVKAIPCQVVAALAADLAEKQ